jgi:hypothetical protein
MENISRISQHETLCDSAVLLANVSLKADFIKNVISEILQLRAQGQSISSEESKIFLARYVEFKDTIDLIIGIE